MTTPLLAEKEAAENFMAEELRRLNETLNPTPKPGEFTAYQYAEANHMTYDRAKGILNRAIRDKKITRRMIGGKMYYTAIT
jgi:hypothetical protein